MSPLIEILPKSGPPQLLFLLFHGVGFTAESMAPLAKALANEYPQAAVVSVHAPHPHEGPGDPNGRQWFSAQGVTDDNRAERIAAALPEFIAVVRSLSQRFGMSWQRTALAGFSQGAVMALEAVQAEAQLAGRVLAFGGRYASLPAHAPEDTTIHLLHGTRDQVNPPPLVVEAAEQLVALGADLTGDVLPGIGHELHPQLIEKALLQLRSFIPKKVWEQAMREARELPDGAQDEPTQG